MDEGEPSGEVKGHPGGGDLSRLALRELQSKVCGLQPWLGWPVGKEVTKTGRQVQAGSTMRQEAGSMQAEVPPKDKCEPGVRAPQKFVSMHTGGCV